MIINLIKAIVFGIIEGITEWIPVSSTAHMMVLNKIIPLDVDQGFYYVFEVVIQLAAIIALVIIFWNKIWPFGKTNNPLGKGVLSYCKKDKFILWIKIAISCIPVIIYELFITDYVHMINENNEMIFVGVALIVVGIIFAFVEMFILDKKPRITSTKNGSITSVQAVYVPADDIDALIIGTVQLIAAIFPGVSRSGITIICALLMGISRTTSVEYTFELSIPTMVGASLMRIIKSTLIFSLEEMLILLLGCVAAFFVSLFMIRFVLNFIRRNKFTMFGIYRVVLGIILLIFFR